VTRRWPIAVEVLGEHAICLSRLPNQTLAATILDSGRSKKIIERFQDVWPTSLGLVVVTYQYAASWYQWPPYTQIIRNGIVIVRSIQVHHSRDNPSFQQDLSGVRRINW
jgi:hypothetical protein